MTGRRNPAGRGIRLLAVLLAAGAVSLLTLAPGAVVGPLRGGFLRLMDAVPEPMVMLISIADGERVLNTMLFVPLGAAAALLMRRGFWPIAILGGFALSAAVEYAQASIPGRVPDLGDVLWNTVGAAIGVAVATVARLVVVGQRGMPQRGSVTRT